MLRRMVGRLTQDVTAGRRKFFEKIQTCRPIHVLVKVKVRPVTGHEVPEVAYSITLTTVQDGMGGWSTPRPGRFTPEKKGNT